MQMFLCDSCFNAKYEPRWLVILTAQEDKRNGTHEADEYLLNHRYYGNEIPAVDLIES